MEMNQFSRTQLLLGAEALEKLRCSRVAVFGIGGVGSYAVEALARSGVGALDLADHDRYHLTNLHRQLYATYQTIGQPKVEAARDRIRVINPDCRVTLHQLFFLPETRDQFDFTQFDYVIDAIDTVAGKLALAEAAQATGTPIISCMGAGNKMDPTAFRVADIYETSVCPLARIMRTECRRRGIRKLKVVYSTEQPVHPTAAPDDGERDRMTDPSDDKKPSGRRDIPGSNAFVPSVAGLILAGEAVKDLIRGLTPMPR